MNTHEVLKLALEALESGVDTQIGRVAWTEYDSCLINEAITAIKEVLAQPDPIADTGKVIKRIDVDSRTIEVWPAQTGQEPVDQHFLRQVLSVAIAGLYENYKEDVLKVFTLDELQVVVDLSEPLRPQQVEDIYRQVWDMLNTTPPKPQPQPEQEPVAWKPIKTAPKDASMILVCLPRQMNIVVRAWYNRIHGFWQTDYEGEGGITRPTYFHEGDLWHPIPPLYNTPPKEQQSCDKRPWVGLTDEEVNWFGWHGTSIRTIEAKLKEKNT